MSLMGLLSSLDMAEERSSELEDISIATSKKVVISGGA